jgi:hypothetical protein
MGASFIPSSKAGARAYKALLHLRTNRIHLAIMRSAQVLGSVTPVWPWYLPPRSL